MKTRLFILGAIFTFLGFGAKGIWLSAGIVWAISGVTAWIRYYFHFHRKYFPRKVPVMNQAALTAEN